MPFERFVQTGRIALVSDGVYQGKLVAIVDVIDQTRVLVDGPCTGVPRQQLRINQLHLTKFKISFAFTAPTSIVRKAWVEGKVDEKWSESLWAKKLASKEKRRSMTDFDRYKLRKARSIRNKVRKIAFCRLKKTASRSGTLNKKKIDAEKKPKTEKKLMREKRLREKFALRKASKKTPTKTEKKTSKKAPAAPAKTN